MRLGGGAAATDLRLTQVERDERGRRRQQSPRREGSQGRRRPKPSGYTQKQWDEMAEDDDEPEPRAESGAL